MNCDVVLQEVDSPVSAPYLWLATSADRRVSVWSADWTKDFCELVDWLTFPAPAFLPDGSVVSNKDKVKKGFNNCPLICFDDSCV